MKHSIFFKTILLIVLANNVPAFAQQPLIANIESRQTQTLNGMWKYIVDPYELGYYDYRGQVRDTQNDPNPSETFFLNYKPVHPSERVEYNFDASDNILVPRDWNSQKEKLFYYEGTLWYYKAFDYTSVPNRRQFVYIGAANYEADVYLNGKKLGKHIGGFTPFNFEITGMLNPKDNFLIIKVDNKRGLEKIPTVNTDWWNYGGITRDVQIVDVAETFIRDYYVQLSPKDRTSLDVWVQLDGKNKANQKVTLEISDAEIVTTLTTDENGFAQKTLKTKVLNYWSPQKPFLYQVNLIHQNQKLTEKIGFRTIETKGADILLNGESVFLRGISIHEENGIRGGRAYSREDAQMLLGWAKELGCNFVRLAHYPHNENMARVADEMGMMVWAEVPVYWTIQWKNEATFLNAKNQLTELITRDKNRSSVIIWSVANETPVQPERTQFLKLLIETARSLDKVRLVSAALEQHSVEQFANIHTIDDPLQQFVDVISFNQYIGWYSGLPESCKSVVFDIKFDKPVIISEFGGDALQGLHGTKEERWTEEFQEDLYIETLKMIDKIPQLRGVSPWILADFRSPRRPLPNIQEGWNRKGLISETGNKKRAFFVLQEYYKVKKEAFETKK